MSEITSQVTGANTEMATPNLSEFKMEIEILRSWLESWEKQINMNLLAYSGTIFTSNELNDLDKPFENFWIVNVGVTNYMINTCKYLCMLHV